MLLSIIAILKNEEKTAVKCLDSVKPLTDELDCELIVIDNQSYDLTVSKAEKYTDNIISDDTNRDISLLRKRAAERAKGEWIFFIDGDEVLRNADEIIRFFKSGEHKEYDYAEMIRKNVFFLFRDFCASELSTRLMRREYAEFSGLSGRILSRKGRSTVISSVIENNGYCCETVRDTDIHSRASRALEITYAELEADKENVGAYMRASEYNTFLWDMENLNIAVDNSLKHFENTEYYPIVCAHRLMLLYFRTDIEKLKELSEKYIPVIEKSGHLSIMAEAYFLRAYALYMSEDFEGSRRVFEQYMSCYKKLSENGGYDECMRSRGVSFILKENYLTAAKMAADCCLMAHDAEGAARALGEISFEDIKKAEDKEYFLNQSFDIMRLKQDYAMAEIFLSSADKMIRGKALSNLETDMNNPLLRAAVIRDVPELKINDKAYSAVYMLRGMLYGDNVPDINAVRELLSSIIKWKPEMSDIILLIIRKGLFAALADIPLINYGVSAAEEYYKKAAERLGNIYSDICKYASEHCTDDPYQAQYAYMLGLWAAISDDTPPDVKMQLFEHCGKGAAVYLKAVYNDRALSDGAILSTDSRAELFIALAYSALSENKMSEFISALKQLARTFPAAKGLVKSVSDTVRSRASGAQNTAAEGEFAVLAKQFKASVKAMAAAGKLAQAAQALMQYKSINPSDPEIPSLEVLCRG